MKHAREDYNRIQDPAGLIPEDEPVVLFRAQDKYAGVALLAYAVAVESDPDATDEALLVASLIALFIPQFHAWPKKKSPDL